MKKIVIFLMFLMAMSPSASFAQSAAAPSKTTVVISDECKDCVADYKKIRAAEWRRMGAAAKVRAFQSACNIRQDGIIGKRTLACMNNFAAKAGAEMNQKNVASPNSKAKNAESGVQWDYEMVIYFCGDHSWSPRPLFCADHHPAQSKLTRMVRVTRLAREYKEAAAGQAIVEVTHEWAPRPEELYSPNLGVTDTGGLTTPPPYMTKEVVEKSTWTAGQTAGVIVGSVVGGAAIIVGSILLYKHYQTPDEKIVPVERGLSPTGAGFSF